MQVTDKMVSKALERFSLYAVCSNVTGNAEYLVDPISDQWTPNVSGALLRTTPEQAARDIEFMLRRAPDDQRVKFATVVGQ